MKGLTASNLFQIINSFKKESPAPIVNKSASTATAAPSQPRQATIEALTALLLKKQQLQVKMAPDKTPTPSYAEGPSLEKP